MESQFPRGALSVFNPRHIPGLATGQGLDDFWMSPKFTRDKDRRLRFMWYSIPPYIHTGYGQTTRNIVGRLQKMGWQFAIAPLVGHYGGVMNWDGFTIYPASDDGLATFLLPYFRHWEGDVLFMHLDPWPRMWFGAVHPRNVLFAPVDRTPIPDALLSIYRASWRVISQSMWGGQVLAKHGIKSAVLSAGVETNVFTPEAGEGGEFRKLIEVPEDAFLVTALGVNNGYRKQFHRLLLAFKEFLQDHPDAYLYLHTDPEVANGLNLRAMAAALEIDARVRFPPTIDYVLGFPAEVIARIYAESDVYINCSSSGGFEIPIIEAMSCGTPAVAQDWGPMGELVGSIAPELLMKPLELEMSSLMGWEAVPSRAEIVRVLSLVHSRGKERWSAKVRGHMTNNLDYDKHIAPAWDKYLLEIQDHLEGRDIKEVQG